MLVRFNVVVVIDRLIGCENLFHKFDGFAKSRIFPPLAGEDKGEGNVSA